MKIKLSPAQWYRVIVIISGSLKAAGAEVKEAKDPDSEKGEKVSFSEAVNIVTAALSAAVEPIASLIADKD